MRRKALLCVLALASTLAFADNKKMDAKKSPPPKAKSLHDQLTGQGYGMAGCGLGSVAFGDKPGMIQVIAATLNGTFGSQTFGISSGTSNCDEGGNSQAKAELFIEVNKQALARDVSRGNGETLNSFAKLVGCKSDTLGSELRNNFDNIFKSESSSAETTQSIFNAIRSNSQLQQCSKLGLS